MVTFKNYKSLCVITAFAAAISSCDSASTDHSTVHGPQFGQQLNAQGINALGDTVSLADFAGRPVWVDYAAEWCAACTPQSATIHSLSSAYKGDVVFVTVMTSEPAGFGHPATQATAQRWAERTSLDPARVVTADFSSMTLPQHALFAPDGTEIFRHTGSLSAAEIRAALKRL
ncbi:MAG: TlpA family protein disulfide reductase [Woeseia sp.]|nr:TlpA family protein disulfide reductase [Woeseia sp.]